MNNNKQREWDGIVPEEFESSPEYDELLKFLRKRAARRNKYIFSPITPRATIIIPDTPRSFIKVKERLSTKMNPYIMDHVIS